MADAYRRRVTASRSSRPWHRTGRSSPCSTSPVPRPARSSSSPRPDAASTRARLAGHQEVPVDARVDAVGEPPVGTVVAHVQPGAPADVGEVLTRQTVGVPGDADGTTGP